MKYLGMYSGKIYDNKKDMIECGIQLSDDQANDDLYVNNLKEMHKDNCRQCYGCPMSFNDHIKY